uniref:Holliday junction recognition protein n=1 Tax=Jaculus jaculus TaxID=51337 RepID=A0A8C5KSS7_JACJA
REPRGPLEDELLLQKLRDSGRRFQRHMLRLLEKYERPFEDDLLVRMATLTYETPQGLRIWGGKLIKERNTKENQVFTITAWRRGGERIQPR